MRVLTYEEHRKPFLHPDWDRAQWRAYIRGTINEIVRNGDSDTGLSFERWLQGERPAQSVKDYRDTITFNTHGQNNNNETIRMAFIDVAMDLPKTKRYARYWDQWSFGMSSTDEWGADRRRVYLALSYQKHVLPCWAECARETLQAYIDSAYSETPDRARYPEARPYIAEIPL